MDLRDLRYFETIAELQHIGHAAQKLHRSQPTLTSCVRRLEEAYGAPLFERAGRGIRLTPAGRILQKWAQRMRFDAEDSKREIGDLGRGTAGHVRIGVVPTAAEFLLPAATRRLLLEAPAVTLKTVVGLLDVLKTQLKAGELDLIVASEMPAEPGFTSRLMAEDSIVVAASADHPILNTKVTMADLTRYRWVLQPPGATTRDWLDHAFDRNLLPRPVVQIESTMLIMLPALIVETGLLSFVSRYHVNKNTQLKEVPLKDATMRRRLTVSYRADSYLLPAAQRLIELLVEPRGSARHPKSHARRTTGQASQSARRKRSAD
jgi:DNA-binding transcriptional LysR family regulator